MPNFLTRRLANFLGFLACSCLIGYAFFAQYVQLLEPCPLCWFQRIVFFVLGVVFLVATLHNPKEWGARVYAVLLVIAALVGIGIAARHIWIQSLPPGSVPSCGASVSYLFEIMPALDVVKKVFSGSGECQHVDAILGVSWPWWTAIMMTILGAWGALTNLRLRK
jgi:disulfide bond formation protein DsbB